MKNTLLLTAFFLALAGNTSFAAELAKDAAIKNGAIGAMVEIAP